MNETDGIQQKKCPRGSGYNPRRLEWTKKWLTAVNLEMSRQCVPTRKRRVSERPFCTRALQRQCLREATRGRCKPGARGRDAGACHEQAGKTPPNPADADLEWCPLTTRHLVNRKQLQQSGVRSRRCAHATRHKPRGDWPDQPRDLDGRARPRSTTRSDTVQTSAWKPLETRPHTKREWCSQGCSASASHRIAGMDYKTIASHFHAACERRRALWKEHE